MGERLVWSGCEVAGLPVARCGHGIDGGMGILVDGWGFLSIVLYVTPSCTQRVVTHATLS